VREEVIQVGILKRVFGGKKASGSAGAARSQAPGAAAYKQCDACGDLAQPSTDVNTMAIFTATIEHWSIEGMAGYCPKCRRFLCSKHLEWRKTPDRDAIDPGGEMGPWEVVCSQCSVPIRGTP
jgi:hypothetical protein